MYKHLEVLWDSLKGELQKHYIRNWLREANGEKPHFALNTHTSQAQALHYEQHTI